MCLFKLKLHIQPAVFVDLNSPQFISLFVEEVNKNGGKKGKTSSSYGLADFGQRTRNDKCALAIIQSALIIL